jgi:hypothetical protein
MKKLVLLSALILTACGGGGDNKTTVTSNVTTQSAPPPAVVQQSTCKNPHNADYPDIYRGSWPTPTPANKFNPKVLRSVSLKDYYAGNGAWRYKECKGDEYSKLMYTITLDRLKALGVEKTWIYQFGPWMDGKKEVWTMDKKDYQIPEHMVEFFVVEAKKRGIDVYLAWQFHTVDRTGYSMFQLGDWLDEKMLRTVLESHRLNMIEMAKFSQRVGIKGLSADWNAMNIGNLHQHRELWITEMVRTVDSIREHFKGDVTYGQSMVPWYDERIYSKVDAIHLSVTPKLTDVENINLSVENVKARALQNIHDSFLHMTNGNLSAKLPPVIFSMSIQSRDKYFTEGWVEDGFCVSGTKKDGGKTDCIQREYVTDFSVQAVGVEGVLQAIFEQRYAEVYAVDFHTSYWLTDDLQPGNYGRDDFAKIDNQSDFPNLSQSIRGKPAEQIVKHWFSK